MNNKNKKYAKRALLLILLIYILIGIWNFESPLKYFGAKGTVYNYK